MARALLIHAHHAGRGAVGLGRLDPQRVVDVAARQVRAQRVADLRLEALDRTCDLQVGAEVAVVDGPDLGAQPAGRRVTLRLAVPRHAPDHGPSVAPGKLDGPAGRVNSRIAT